MGRFRVFELGVGRELLVIFWLFRLVFFIRLWFEFWLREGMWLLKRRVGRCWEKGMRWGRERKELFMGI